MYLENSKTVVIKIGSSLLINEKKIIRKKKNIIKNIRRVING